MNKLWQPGSKKGVLRKAKHCLNILSLAMLLRARGFAEVAGKLLSDLAKLLDNNLSHLPLHFIEVYILAIFHTLDKSTHDLRYGAHPCLCKTGHSSD